MAFLNHMLDVLRNNYDSNQISLTNSFHQDVNWFQKFLPTFNDKALFDHTSVAGEILLDARLEGLGACFTNQIYVLKYLWAKIIFHSTFRNAQYFSSSQSLGLA